MEYRRIGNTELKLSAISFGAWAIGGWMWGGSDYDESIRAIQAAYDHGVTTIDTAPVYGQGESEMIVGEAIKTIPREKLQILTKFGLRWDMAKGSYYFSTKDTKGRQIDVYKYAGKDSIIEECEKSLRHLKTDYIDLYQIHWPDNTTPVQESMEAVEILIKSGKVRYAGVCNYSLTQFQEANKYLDIVSNQVSYSMIKREIEKELVPFMVENNKSVLAYSPLGRGILTGKIKPGHQFAEGDHRSNLPAYNNENISLINNYLNKIEPLAREKEASTGQLVIRWTIDQPGISVALVGARTAEQAIQNAKASDIFLSDSEYDFINKELEKITIKQ